MQKIYSSTVDQTQNRSGCIEKTKKINLQSGRYFYYIIRARHEMPKSRPNRGEPYKPLSTYITVLDFSMKIRLEVKYS